MPAPTRNLTFPVEKRPRRWAFLLAVLGATIAFAVFSSIFGSYVQRLRSETQEECRLALSKAVLAMAERFNRPRWMFFQARPLFERLAGKPFTPRSWRILARRLGRQFPGAMVYAFDPQGRMIFQPGNEPRRTRELLWQGLLANIRQEASGDRAEQRLGAASRICRSLFGSATSLNDLSGTDRLPQPFLNRERIWLSWAIPPESISGGTASGGGGIWLLVDPEKLPAAEIGRGAVRQMDPRLENAWVVRPDDRSNPIESSHGPSPLRRSVLRRIRSNPSQIQSPNGLWMSRYIPGENGRYLVAGIGADTLQGSLPRYHGRILGAVLLLLLIGLALAWWTWWRGEPLPLELRHQVVILFSLTAILPLGMLIVFGRERAREVGRLERSRWEERLFSTLNTIDVSYVGFQDGQQARLERIEAELARRLPSGSDPGAIIDEACSGMNRFELLAMEASGRSTRRNHGVNSPQRENDETRKIACQFVTRILQTHQQQVPKAYSDKHPLLQGDELDRLINNVFRTCGQFQRMKAGKRQILTRSRIMNDSRNRFQVFLSWVFDEPEFARPFVKQILEDTEAGRFGVIRVALVGEDGRVFPASVSRSIGLLDLSHRVASFRSHEFADLEIGGRRVLAAGFPPVKLGGYQLLAWVDAGVLVKESQALSWFLVLMVIWSLIWMTGCALFLSRRLVGQVTGLREFVGQIAVARFEARAAVSSGDELGQLAETFNAMAEKLQHRERLRRFVSEQEWDETKKADLAMGGSRVEAAVLFSHIHGFDGILEREPPDRLIVLLNGYFSRMDPIIRHHHGQIDKLIGDAIMAVFLDQPGQAPPALRAARTAAALLAETRRLAEVPGTGGAGQPGIALRTDIGVHFGPVISGNIGSREGRINHTVIGDTVNTAARLCSAAAKRPQPAVIVSGAVRALLTDKMHLTPLEPMPLKGKTEIIELFELVIPTGSSPE